MDWDLIKLLATTTGPMGILAYGMFRHHSLLMQSNAEARIADEKAHSEARAADAHHHAGRLAAEAKAHADRLVEIAGDRKSERDILVNVVRENTVAVTALTAKIDTDLGFHRRASDHGLKGDT